MMGRMDSPSSLREYSTLGGTSAYTVLVIIPSSSMERRLSVKTFWLIPSRSFFNSLKRQGRTRRFLIINSFHLLPIKETVVATGQAGMYAPSAGGRQGVIFAVCQDKEVNEKLGKIKRANSNFRMSTAASYVSKEQPSIVDDSKLINAFYGAPTVITMFAPRNFLFSVDDCAVAAENMMLMATSLGVGSCYIGQGWTAFADPFGQEILKKWDIPDGYYAVMQLLLGYPRKEDKHPTAKPRKEKRILRF